MKEDGLEIIDKKDINTIVEELQFLTSNMLPQLKDQSTTRPKHNLKY